jgi:acetoacetate decarboxylase
MPMPCSGSASQSRRLSVRRVSSRPLCQCSRIVCQLVAINLTDIVVKGSWIGPGRLHLVPHVNAPVADFPVRRVVGAHHFLADLTLPYGRVVYDYNKQGEDLAEAAE